MSEDRLNRIEEMLQGATKHLADAGVGNPARDARWILAAFLGVTPDRIMSGEPEKLGLGGERSFYEALWARAAGKPVSKIIGKRLFWDEEFRVTRDVLDPRPETEVLVAEALKKPFDSLLDLGTGSGCILVSLLQERREATGLGTDISEKALRVARQNVQAAGCADVAQLRLSDWFEAVDGQYDLIVSNPPYITLDEMDALAPEVRDHDPRIALTDEDDGLSAYRVITAEAGNHLQKGGRLMVEIGSLQGRAVRDMFMQAGFEQIRVLPDLDGRDRVVSGVWPG